LATSTLLARIVVGTPFLPKTDARAKPKLPAPKTATRTGYGGVVRYDACKTVVVGHVTDVGVMRLPLVKALHRINKEKVHTIKTNDAGERNEHRRLNITAIWNKDVMVK
jgi:hypothetical protein